MGGFLAKRSERKIDEASAKEKTINFIRTRRPSFLEDGRPIGLIVPGMVLYAPVTLTSSSAVLLNRCPPPPSSPLLRVHAPPPSVKKIKKLLKTIGLVLPSSVVSSPTSAVIPGGLANIHPADDSLDVIDERDIQRNRKFLNACIHGNFFSVNLFLKQRAFNVEIKDVDGSSGLHLAANGGHHRIVRMLVLRRQAQVNTTNQFGWTPLHSAVFNGHIQVVHFLLMARADIFKKEKYGCTALHFVACSPKLYLIDFVTEEARKDRGKLREGEFKKHLLLAQRRGGTESSKKTKRKEKKNIDDGTEEEEDEEEDEIGEIVHAANSKEKSPEEFALNRWRLFPNKMELIIIDKIIDRGLFFREKTELLNSQDLKLRTPLIYAAQYGHVFACSRLLFEQADVHAGDRTGATALHYAVRNEHAEVVELLLMAKALVNATDLMHQTPLHCALKTKNVQISALLLTFRADVNAFDADGKTPIMVAMDQKRPDLFNLLLTHNPNLDALDERGWNCLIYSVHNDLLPSLLIVLSLLAKEDVKSIVLWQDPQGMTALHHAVTVRKLEYVRIIHELDDNVLIPDCNGNTPLHMAAQVGDFDVMNLLTSSTDDIDPQNNFGETPLMLAAHSGHMACLLSLLSLRRHLIPADATMEDLKGRTVFMHACISGVSDLVKLFLLNREENNRNLALVALKINQTDKDGNTPLLLAAQNGHWHLISLLVLAGANSSNKDNDGWTALHYAAYYGESLTVSALLDCGAHIDEVDNLNWTPLMHAVSANHLDSVQTLVDRRADLQCKNSSGQSVFDIAMCHSNSGSLRAILSDALRYSLGLLGIDENEEFPSLGHFAVTLISASDLLLEGREPEQLFGVYACMQFLSQSDKAISSAFTSAGLSNGDYIEWHETVRFDLEALDTGSFICIELFSVPSQEQEDYHVKSEGIRAEKVAKRYNQRVVKSLEAKKGEEAKESEEAEDEFDENGEEVLAEKFKKSMMEIQKQANISAEAKEALRCEKMLHLTIADRRRKESESLRQQLFLGLKITVPNPPVVESHIFLGMVLVPFRSLRESVCQSKDGGLPIRLTRPLRRAVRGSIVFEIDFRPKLFSCFEPSRSIAEEQDKVVTPRLQHVLASDEFGNLDGKNVPTVTWGGKGKIVKTFEEEEEDAMLLEIKSKKKKKTKQERMVEKKTIVRLVVEESIRLSQ